MSRRRWALFAILAVAPVLAQNAQVLRTGNRGAGDNSFPPHKIIGNLYYVGSDEHCSFLIVTPAGNILINSGYETTVPMIRAAVEKLGFHFTDTKIVLGSHAHPDHMQGDALVKELTAARVMAVEQDVPALEKMRPGNKPHPVDRVLHDGDEVELGGTKLAAHLTPGHTKGCTSWTFSIQEGGKSYNVVIVCGMGANTGQALVNNQDYPQIADDYARGFKTLRALPCDVFLGSHTGHYGMQEKYAKLQPGGPNPFIDPQGYQAHLDFYETTFRTKLKEEQQRAQAGTPQ
jgi:metallo-beta-lactamase class B